jgi:hypothetical protein
VGIGTSLPGNPLTLVYGGGAVGAQIIGNASYAQMQVTAAGANTNSYFTFGANGTGKGIIQRNSTDVITIDASNNVGIGTSSPTANLTAAGLTGTTIIQALGGDSNGFADVEIKSTGSSGGSRLYFSDTAAQSGLIRYSHNTDSMEFTTAGTERAPHRRIG